MVLRDDDGQVIFSACCQLFKYIDPLEAKARPSEEGLTLALQQSELPIEVESDCFCYLSN
jgi:hypothetical protein